jgi:AtzE family amidohydrolase
MIGPDATAIAIAHAIAQGEISAVEVARAALERIERLDQRLNCFTAITSERALAEAREIDALRARGAPLPPLAGVPFAVKNLFDVAGLTTLAGSKINAELSPASADATLVARMKAAGAVLVGALNMDEYAYGFVTENTHYGPTRNPHDPTRIAGGSSGGSAAAIAAGLVPITLGSDTNGSIRVPASLCGVFGLKATFGRLSRRGAFPFVASLDHTGPFARSVADLAAAYDATHGPDPADPACATRASEPTRSVLAQGIDGLRIAIAGGYFNRNASEEARAAVATAAGALKASRTIELPEVERARAAAFVITAAEGGNLHLPNLRTRAADFDPEVRDRLLAGALIPSAWVLQAQRFRNWFRARVLDLFREVDVIIAAATPVSATPIGQQTMLLNGVELPLRASMGLLTQPISFIGLPVVAAPLHKPNRMPLAVQLIAAPWREDVALRLAACLEREGIASAPVARS